MSHPPKPVPAANASQTVTQRVTTNTSAGHWLALGVTVGIAALLVADPVVGHPIHGTGQTSSGGLLAGFFHPLLGLDHLLAMLALGVWAGQLGRPFIQVLPAVFPALMGVGAAVALAGVGMPAVEPMIAASLVALGLAVAFRLSLPVVPVAVGAGLFGLFHGHAHGAELPAATSPVGYVIGFLLATLLLHVVGAAIGWIAGRPGRGRGLPRLVQAGGSAIAVAGAGLLLV